MATLAAQYGATVEVVGAWVWATFAAKPDETVRDALKAAGFRWNHKRRLWQNPCGVMSGGSPLTADELRIKYDAQRWRNLHGLTAAH